MSTQTPPRSTLTGQPCTGHAPGDRCVECVGEGAFRFEPLALATEEEDR